MSDPPIYQVRVCVECGQQCEDGSWDCVHDDGIAHLGASTEVCPIGDFDLLSAQTDDLREAADRVLRAASSFCESLPFAAPETVGHQWNAKMLAPLGALDSLIHPAADAKSEADSDE